MVGHSEHFLPFSVLTLSFCEKCKNRTTRGEAKRFGAERRGKVEGSVSVPLFCNTTCKTIRICCAAICPIASQRNRLCRTLWLGTRARGAPASRSTCCTPVSGLPLCSPCWCATRSSGRCRTQSRTARCPAKDCLRVSYTRTW